MLLTLDSSVIVASIRSGEPHHEECRKVLDDLSNGRHLGVQPLTVLVEVVASIRRRSGSEPVAQGIYQSLLSLGLRFVALDRARASAAQQIARRTGLRGMDAIVVQVAVELGSVLVTFDNEMAQRAADLVTIRRVMDL